MQRYRNLNTNTLIEHTDIYNVKHLITHVYNNTKLGSFVVLLDLLKIF